MGWSTIIFGFGFILGVFTGVLILGMVCLSGEQTGEQTANSEYSGFVREPRQGDPNPVISPQLTIFNGRKAPSGPRSPLGSRSLSMVH